VVIVPFQKIQHPKEEEQVDLLQVQEQPIISFSMNQFQSILAQNVFTLQVGQ
jgi:hypothetical protein